MHDAHIQLCEPDKAKHEKHLSLQVGGVTTEEAICPCMRMCAPTHKHQTFLGLWTPPDIDRILGGQWTKAQS